MPAAHSIVPIGPKRLVLESRLMHAVTLRGFLGTGRCAGKEGREGYKTYALYSLDLAHFHFHLQLHL